ncbi:MAG: MauE/DoxX family redox-associated membrane protein [Phycisphaerae bacterium]
MSRVMLDSPSHQAGLTRVPRDWFWIPRLFISVVVLAAAGLKIHQLSTEPLSGTGLLANRWIHLAEADCEIVMAIWLLSGWARRLAWAAALAMFAALSAVTANRFLAGEASCGCFGRLTVPPLFTLVLDLSTIAMLLLLRPKGATWWPSGRWRRPCVAGAVAALALVVSAIPMLRFSPAKLTAAGAMEGEDPTVLLEPETWVGRPLPIAKHIDIADDVARGDWLVVLVRDGCAGCAALLPQLAAKARNVGPGMVAKIALVHVPPHKESSEPLFQDGLFLNGRLDESRDWFVQTPTVLRLKDGTVTDVVIAQGDVNRRKVLDAELPVVPAAEGVQTIDAAPGSSRTVLFVVRNPAAEPLSISGTKSDSISLSVKDTPKRIPPYSFVLVSVTFVAPSEPSPDWSGQVTLRTDDPARPAVSLTLHANIR